MSSVKSSSKRKRDGSTTNTTAAAAAPAADLKSWMRDVIQAPPAPEDAPKEIIQQEPVEMEVDDGDETATTPAAEHREHAAAVPRQHYSHVRDLFAALQSTKTETVFGGLVRFHRQMKDETARGHASAASGQSSVDPSPSILAQYWANSPDAKEIFAILDTIASHEAKKQNQILSKTFEVMARMILPSTIGFNYAYSQTLLRKIIRSSKYFPNLTRLLKMSDQRLVQAGLTFLLHTIITCGSNMSGVRTTGPTSSALLRELVTKFPFTSKWWLEIPYKPYVAHGHGAKKSKDASTAAAASDAQAQMQQEFHRSRGLFINIIVELLGKKDLEITTFILGIKGYVTSVLKHLHRDPVASFGNLDAFLHALVHHILYLPNLPNQVKFGFFNGYVLEMLCELFKERPVEVVPPTTTEGGKKSSAWVSTRGRSSKEQSELIERTMREFISYIAKHQHGSSSAAFGQRFRSVAAGAAAAAGGADSSQSGIRQYGPLLLRILSHLHANESAVEQALTLQILSGQFPPQITAEYLGKFSYTFEPRLSPKWINHIDLMCKIWKQPINWEGKNTQQAISGGQAAVQQEYPLLVPYVPFHGGVPLRSTPSNASTFPLLFSYLLPSTLSQRITWSTCIQHAHPLVKYSTLALMHVCIARFKQLQGEFAREWKQQQGLPEVSGDDNDHVVAVTPQSLSSSLLTHRHALAKILPDVQVLFGLRTKLVPGHCATLKEMQAALTASIAAAEGGESTESTTNEDGDETQQRKKRKGANGAPTDDGDKEPDSSIADLSVESTTALASQSRHLLYARFLGVLVSFAESLPDALLEGRVDLLKLIPSVNATGEKEPQHISWFALGQLCTLWRLMKSYAQTKMFTLSQTPTSDLTLPCSPFGSMLRLLSEANKPDGESTLLVQGHESAILCENPSSEVARSTPNVVRMQLQEVLVQALVHTGLFKGRKDESSRPVTHSDAVLSTSSAALEEIHLWLASVRTTQDARVFELLVTSLIGSSSTLWQLKEQQQQGEESDMKDIVVASSASSDNGTLSLLLAASTSPAFQSSIVSSGLQSQSQAFITRFVSILSHSAVLGESTKGQVSKLGLGVAAGAKKSKSSSSSSSDATPPAVSVPALTTSIALIASDPTKKSCAQSISSIDTNSLAESAKLVLIAHAKVALDKILSTAAKKGGSASVQPGLSALWTLVAALIRSPSFDTGSPASKATVDTRLGLLLHRDHGEGLIEHFLPSSTEPDLFTEELITLVLSLHPTTLASHIYTKLVDSCVTQAKNDRPNQDEHKLPFALALLQRCLGRLNHAQLAHLAQSLCVSTNGWIAYLAGLPGDESELVYRLLKQSGTQAVQLLSQLIQSPGGDSASSTSTGKKSRKSTAASTSSSIPTAASGSTLVLERLLLKLLSSPDDSATQLVDQLSPTFFTWSLSRVGLSSSSDDSAHASEAAGVHAHLAALLLRSGRAPLFVPLLATHILTLEPSEESTVERFIPLIQTLVQSSFLAGDQREKVHSFVSQALQQSFVPAFLASHAAAAKNPSSPAAHTCNEIISLVKLLLHHGWIVEASKRATLLQWIVTGTKPAAPEGKTKATKSKHSKKSSKKAESSSDSSDSDSDSDSDDDEDTAPSVDSIYEYVDPVRFELCLTLLTTFPAEDKEDSEDVTPPLQSSLAQSYSHFVHQTFAALHRSSKARAKLAEGASGAKTTKKQQEDDPMDGSTSSTATAKPKGLLSVDQELHLVQSLSLLLSSSRDSSFASGPSAASQLVKWLTMLPLHRLASINPNTGLTQQLMSTYAKAFSTLLRFGYTDVTRVALLRNLVLWQLDGSEGRNIFLHKIVALKSNPRFTVPTGQQDDKGEEIEEDEVPSLLSICALAASPKEDFKPVTAKFTDVPTAQTLFEMVVSHSKFVSVIAPGAVAPDDDEEQTPAKLAEALALQLEYLQILLLLFSFPDSSPPCDMKLQGNLWLLLFSTYHASTSTSDCLIKLLLDLFEEIALGVKTRKQHKKMEYELITSQRKWGLAGLQMLSNKISEGDAASSSTLTTLQDMDPSSWLYANFQASLLSKGPIVSKRPPSSITSAIGAVEGQHLSIQTSEQKSEDVSLIPNDVDLSGDIRYDPSFILPFFHHFFTAYQVDARRFIDLNGLSYIIQSMSHSSVEIRRMAYACMGKFQSVIEAQNASLTEEKAKEKLAAAEAAKSATTSAKKVDDDSSDDEIGVSKRAAEKKAVRAEKLSKTWEAKKALYHDANRQRSAGEIDQVYSFKEYPQVALLLTVLKNGITQRYQLLPGIISSFLARACPILLRPDHALYKSINRFLLARPLLDLSDIPLFYAYFHSSSPDWKLARSFLLRVLKDGFVTDRDYELIKRRHVSEMILNFVAHKGLSDKYSRLAGFQVLESGVLVSPAFLAELVRVHAFFAWVSQGVLGLRPIGAIWASFVPVLVLAERTLEQLRARLPEQPEEDVLVEDKSEEQRAEEESEGDTSSDDEQDEKTRKQVNKTNPFADDDIDMVDVNGEGFVGEKVIKDGSAPYRNGAPHVKTPLSPAAEALKALRKRQRQRGQIARELVLLIETLAGKFHEWLWAEGLVKVASTNANVLPMTHGSSAPTQSSLPIPVVHSVVESVLRVLNTAMQTAQRAHVASRRLTNRAQLVQEGSASSGLDYPHILPHDSFAPVAIAPVVLHALATLPDASPTISIAFADHVAHVMLHSSPSSMIPRSLTDGGLLLSVRDSQADLIHFHHSLAFLASHIVRSTNHRTITSFLSWLDLLLASHPDIVDSWWSPSPHVALTQTLQRFYIAAEQDQVAKLNKIFARVLGVSGKDGNAVVVSALKGSGLSSTQREAYASAWSTIVSVWPALSSGHGHVDEWTNGFVSLILQELLTLQSTHATHAAVTTIPLHSISSTAFALLRTTFTPKKDKSQMRAKIITALSNHATAFAIPETLL